MISGKRVLAIIPARGGSKGVKNKNIREVGGKPLINWTIEAGLGSKYIDRMILSSDDQKIISVAEDAKCEAPFVRPEYLSTDEAKSIDVVLHAVEFVADHFDIVVLLQPTSPLRTSSDIDGALTKYIDTDAQAIVSVSAVEKSPYWMYQLQEPGDKIQPVVNLEEIPLRRQDAPECFALNGAIYVIDNNVLRNEQTFLPEDTRAYVMNQRSSIDIDTEEDLNYLKFVVGESK
ncbi:MAG: acylneuraminate cytidylyltransferase family protein [Kangiellaceae bacterium]|nr:acylneuraminate cytidylyltransferase family protein [Kangiellaceae bacterium]MCW8999741.1 acylneuraminate cytidylyltransferase family protein [Kangiellaceae bacterium]